MPNVLVLTESNDEDIMGLSDEHPVFYFYQNQRELVVFSQTPLSKGLDSASSYTTSILCFETANTKFYAMNIRWITNVPKT